MVCEPSSWLWTQNPVSEQPCWCLHSATLSAFKLNKSIHWTEDTRVKLCPLFLFSSFLSNGLPLCLPLSLPSFPCVFVWVLIEKETRLNQCCHRLPRGGFGLYKSTGPTTAIVTQRHPCGEFTEITYFIIHFLPSSNYSISCNAFINRSPLYVASYTIHITSTQHSLPSIYSSLCQLILMGRGHH